MNDRDDADLHLSGDPDKVPISRGVPIDKAMADDARLMKHGVVDEVLRRGGIERQASRIGEPLRV